MPTRIGRYEVEGLLGEGAMGRVYRARDPRSGDPVAVKVIKKPFCDDAQAMKRFIREAEAVSRLSHPGLVGVVEAGKGFIALELIEGESLDAMFARRGAFSPGELLPILRAIGDVLDYIHARGVIHRDVKPSNILVPYEGGVKLTDFGVAHLSWEPMTRTGELLGSPAYMAPEQITLGDVEPASDLHALGVVAWEGLVGRRPFDAPTFAGLMMRVTTRQAPSAHRARPSLPPEVDAVFARALAKDPDERFASARAFVEALDRHASARGRARLAHMLAAAAPALVRGLGG